MRRIVLLVALATIALIAPVVNAQTGGDKQLAQALFNEGKRLMDAKDYAQACPKFADSQKLDPGVGTLLNLAVCYEKNGQTASAWATYEEVAAAAKGAGQAERETYARERAAALAALLAKLMIAVPPESAIEGLSVTRDGVTLPRSGWGLAAPVDPGEHVVAASAPKRKPWSTTVHVSAKGTGTVTVPELEKLPEETPPPPPPSPATPPPPSTSAPAPPPPAVAADTSKPGSTQRTIGWVVTGVGGAAVGVGVVLGFVAKSQFDKSNANNNGNPECVNDVCSDQGIRAREGARGTATGATVFFIGGAVFAAGGLALVLTAPSSQPKTGLTLAPTPGGAMLRGSW